MRYRCVVIAVAAPILVALSAAAIPVSADYPGPGPGPTVGCNGASGQLSFQGQCVGVPGPGAPTQPAVFHHWATGVPAAQPACTPYTVTQWATGISTDGWSWSGSFWTVVGQKVPILYSTPLQDTGWVWQVSCGSPGSVRYVGYQQLARHPDPCLPGTPASACRPGFNVPGFLDAVQGAVPAEQIQATPPSVGLVGAPVELTLAPNPVTEQAVIDVTVPDLGDGDPAEGIHVVWVVQAAPTSELWSRPDGTVSSDDQWTPQVQEQGGAVVATVTYAITGFGFWSDGLAVHPLSRQTVGAITVTARLPYSVEQVQSNLG